MILNTRLKELIKRDLKTRIILRGVSNNFENLDAKIQGLVNSSNFQSICEDVYKNLKESPKTTDLKDLENEELAVSKSEVEDTIDDLKQLFKNTRPNPIWENFIYTLSFRLYN